MQSNVKLRKKLNSKEKPTRSKKDITKATDESPKEEEVKTGGINIDFKRIIIRCVVIVTIIAVVNYTQGNKVETFASEKEEIQLKEDTFDCSADFLKGSKKFQGCMPKKCGRFVTDTKISLSEAQALSVIAQKVFSRGGPQGRESEYAAFDLYSGTLTKGNNVFNVYKNDNAHKVVTAEDLKIYRHITDKIKETIVDKFELKSNSLFLTQPTFFSMIDPRFSDALHEENYWAPRTDKEKFDSYSYTAHLFLTDQDYHFKGGRLVFVDQYTNKTVEPKIGRIVGFTSGSENVNFVERVTSGTRLAVTIPFTCDPKKDIKDIKVRS